MNKENTLEKEIDSIDNIKEWNLKIKKIKELKDKITMEKDKINSFIEMINSNEPKKTSKKKKDISLDQLVDDFSKSDNIESKVKTYCLIQSLIRETEHELFDYNQ
jgi:uncharacterized protein YpuA (DUF1002 family)